MYTVPLEGTRGAECSYGRPPGPPAREAGLKDEDWQGQDEATLERLLIERWLYRGLLLGVMLGAAVGCTYLGVRGVTTALDRVTVGVLLLLGLAAGAMAFVMRGQDLRLYRELRRRRSTRP